jgi:hypothetical protein
VTATVTGPEDRLQLLASVTDLRGSLAEDLARVLLPKDLPDFAAKLAERAGAIDRLLEDGRQLLERAQRLVGRLLRCPELEDDVVASAVARADSRRPDDDE